MLQLPGLIDPHVHLREPGATHKEDFDSGTAAALAGGFTAVLAMPNTQPPLTDQQSLAQAQASARNKARCDYGIHLGAGIDNSYSTADLASQVCGLKMYLDQTYGPLRLDDLAAIRSHFATWPNNRPILAHAEKSSLAVVLLFAAWRDQRLHICHVSRKEEIMLIREAKERGLQVTCEVTPHHLFLTQDDISQIGGGRGEVRPVLASSDDRDALWENLEVIDCFATDHAPHTLLEKEGENPPPGFPGMETALSLFLTAVHDGRLTMEAMVSRMEDHPRRIFGLPSQQGTYVEVDPEAAWEVRAEDFHSRCGWSPFEGMQLRGRVRRVTMRDQLVYEDGEVHAPLGFGLDLSLAAQ